MLFETTEDAELILLGGEPIDEPMVTCGPFFMNKPEEIQAPIRTCGGQVRRLD